MWEDWCRRLSGGLLRKSQPDPQNSSPVEFLRKIGSEEMFLDRVHPTRQQLEDVVDGFVAGSVDFGVEGDVFFRRRHCQRHHRVNQCHHHRKFSR